MLSAKRPDHQRRKDFREMGHYAVGTANLISTSYLDKHFHPGVWEGSAQKPMLYFAVGGQVEDHDTGVGHRRTVEEVNKMDYSNYMKR